MSPIREIIAMESPALRAILARPLSSPLRGKSADSSVYPGKNRIKGSPNTMRNTLEGKRAMKIIRMTESTFIPKSKFSGRIFTMPPPQGQTTLCAKQPAHLVRFVGSHRSFLQSNCSGPYQVYKSLIHCLHAELPAGLQVGRHLLGSAVSNQIPYGI